MSDKKPSVKTSTPTESPKLIGEIISNVPLPERTSSSLYNFEKMKVGESFGINKPRKQVSSSASSAGRKLDYKFTVSGDPTKEFETRCWRVS